MDAALASNAARPARPATVARRHRSVRLLLLTELFPPSIGGSAVLLHGIYSRLPSADAVVVLTDRCAPPLSPTGHAGRLRIVRRPIATRRYGVLDPRGLAYHLRVAARILALGTRDATVVHCARAVPEGVSAMIARLLGGPRYVCWAHGEDLAAARSSRELSALTRWVYRFAAAAFANSRNTAALLRSFGVDDAKIRIVYPAVDSERFRPDVDGSAVRSRYASEHDVLLLSVGRLQRRKGHDVAIEALARLRDDCPNLQYVIAGDGQERGRLERLACDCGVADRVWFVGSVSDADLPAYYAAADVFLLPNRVDDGDIEGFGIVFLEAAATGKPVIAGDSGGVPEAVSRDATGLLVDGASVESVAAAIRTLATSADRRRTLGEAGAARARERFGWERAASEVADVDATVRPQRERR